MRKAIYKVCFISIFNGNECVLDWFNTMEEAEEYCLTTKRNQDTDELYIKKVFRIAREGKLS